jgi:hypothetical protein
MPPDRATPGSRAAQRHLAGDAEVRREVAKDALIEGAGYADPDPAYLGHAPSSMSGTELDESYMKMAAREILQTQDAPEDEEEIAYEGEEEYLDDGFDLEPGGTLTYDERVLSAEADERGQAFAADERERSHFFAGTERDQRQGHPDLRVGRLPQGSWWHPRQEGPSRAAAGAGDGRAGRP